MSAPNIPDLPAIPDGIDPQLVTRELASAFHPEIIKELARRGVDSSISTTNLLSISDHFYKVSGLSGKQEAKPTGPGFSIQIVLGDSPSNQKTITIGETTSTLGEVPEFMLAQSVGNLEAIV